MCTAIGMIAGRLRRLAGLSAAMAAMAAMLLPAQAATAAPAPPSTLAFNHGGTACASSSGNNLPSGMSQTGIAFDGTNLLFSCWGDTTITLVSPTSGGQVALHHVAGNGVKAFGALAYDMTSHTLWACGSYSTTAATEKNSTEVGTIDLATDTYMPRFTTRGCINGLAVDPADGSLWASPNIASAISHYSTSGSLIRAQDIRSLLGCPGAPANSTNGGCNSGIAIGGGSFYLANPQTTTKRVFRVNPAFTGSTQVLSSSHRYEDMECDDQSFSKTVMWVMWFNQNIVKPLPIQGTCTASPPPPSPLSVTESAPGSAIAGSNVTFHVTVQNAGPDIQHAVALDDPLPANAGLVQTSPSTGSCSVGSDDVCSLGDIAPGANVTVDLTFATYGPGSVSSTPSVTSTETSQPVSATASVTVTAAPGVSYVSVTDSGFGAASPAPGLGGDVRFVLLGSSAHDLTDSSTHLFDSGPLTPPGAFDWAATAAGAYIVTDSPSGHSTTIQVPTQNPATASVGVPFTVVWSTAPLPAGYSETVQVLLPGTTTWQTWKAKQAGASTSAAYTVAATPGKYKFRAKLTGPSGSTVYGTANTTTVS
jgi:uncharacterized repeat protein (TIGR01451 family)